MLELQLKDFKNKTLREVLGIEKRKKMQHNPKYAPKSARNHLPAKCQKNSILKSIEIVISTKKDKKKRYFCCYVKPKSPVE